MVVLESVSVVQICKIVKNAFGMERRTTLEYATSLAFVSTEFFALFVKRCTVAKPYQNQNM